VRADRRALDQARGSAHRDALDAALEALKSPDIVPVGPRAAGDGAQPPNSFLRFALAGVDAAKACLTSLELPREVLDRFERLAQWSLERQREIEAADKVPFEACAEIPVAYTLVV